MRSAGSAGPGLQHLRGTVDRVVSETSSHPGRARPRRLVEGPSPPYRALDRRGEGVIVAVSQNLTQWTVVALAAISAIAWLLGRNSRSLGLRQALWIFVVSQLIALVLVLFAVFFKWLLILGLIACAVIAIAFLFLDRR